jgi:hypothetical protein
VFGCSCAGCFDDCLFCGLLVWSVGGLELSCGFLDGSTELGSVVSLRALR